MRYIYLIYFRRVNGWMRTHQRTVNEWIAVLFVAPNTWRATELSICALYIFIYMYIFTTRSTVCLASLCYCCINHDANWKQNHRVHCTVHTLYIVVAEMLLSSSLYMFAIQICAVFQLLTRTSSATHLCMCLCLCLFNRQMSSYSYMFGRYKFVCAQFVLSWAQIDV